MSVNKNAFSSKVTQLSQGMTQNFTSKNSLVVGGQSMTLAQIVAQLATVLSLDTNVTTARSAWQAQVAANRAGMPAAKKWVTALIAVIKSTFGEGSPLLASFGIAPPKPRTARTALEKAVTTALSANTRAVRGTKGAKQKAAITLTGKPGVVVLGTDGQPMLSVSPVLPGSGAPPTVLVGAAAAASTGAAGSTTSSPAAAPAATPAGSTSGNNQ